MTFDKNDLLRQAGYAEGDTLRITTLEEKTSANASTTSTSFVLSESVTRMIMSFDDIPVGATFKARLFGFAIPGSGETYDVRLQWGGDSTTFLQLNDIDGTVNSDWQTVTFSNRSATGDFKFEHRTNPGSNSSAFADASIQFGIEL